MSKQEQKALDSIREFWGNRQEYRSNGFDQISNKIPDNASHEFFGALRKICHYDEFYGTWFAAHIDVPYDRHEACKFV